MCRSVPQIPVLCTRIRTSLIPISGSGTSSSQRPACRLGLDERLHAATLGENHGPAIREPPDAATPLGEQRPGMDTFWTVITVAAVVAILAAVLWAFVVAPLWVPRHSGKP